MLIYEGPTGITTNIVESKIIKKTFFRNVLWLVGEKGILAMTLLVRYTGITPRLLSSNHPRFFFCCTSQNLISAILNLARRLYRGISMGPILRENFIQPLCKPSVSTAVSKRLVWNGNDRATTFLVWGGKTESWRSPWPHLTSLCFSPDNCRSQTQYYFLSLLIYCAHCQHAITSRPRLFFPSVRLLLAVMWDITMRVKKPQHNEWKTSALNTAQLKEAGSLESSSIPYLSITIAKKIEEKTAGLHFAVLVHAQYRNGRGKAVYEPRQCTDR